MDSVTSTRDRALTAAVRLVGRDGIRSLTHARVDAAAGIPRGSTSNYFRTRAALVAGVIEHIARDERESLDSAIAPAHSHDEVADALSRVVAELTGPHAERTRARYALSLEMSGDPDVQAPLRAQRGRFEEWTREVLTNLGAEHPETAAKALLAFCGGLILHRLTVDPDAPLRPTIDAAVRVSVAARPHDE